MTTQDILQIAAYLLALFLVAPPLGAYMARVFTGNRHVLSRPLGWLERSMYRVVGVDPNRAMGWKWYALSLLLFNGLGIVIVFLLQVMQGVLPLNPQHLPGVPWLLAANTAISFVTNTNWQSYAGETTLSYFTQMLGLAVQNFLSAATGLAVALALIRGLILRQSKVLGNFWADMTRAVVYVLLPLSLILAVVFVAEGTVQTFAPYHTVTTLEGHQQTIPLGPAASQIAIKMLGTNGGGFFNTNSAHPYENPTPVTNFLQILALLAIPAALPLAFGRMIGRPRHGWLIFGVMLTLFLGGLSTALYAEYSPNSVTGLSAGMEGKETRFGVVNSVVFTVATTDVSCGAVNNMHSSLSPLAGGVALFNIMVGEIIFGGVGAGLYGMLLFVLLTVFLAGLVVGRTPEYLGKKIEAYDIKMVILALLIPNAVILVGAGITAVLPAALSSLANKGPHGLSELLYAFGSTANNNGSAFAGLNTNTNYFNLLLGVAMLLGRFGVIVPVLAVAGNMVRKNIAPFSPGTFSTESSAFAALLVAVITVVGALTFLPALSLGPIVEQFLMASGRVF